MQGKRISHFEVLEPLGRGGMGVVYRARDERLGRQVALKFLPGEVGSDKLERLEREARAASSLNHPNICTIFELGEYEGRAFIAMEYLEGDSLEALLEQGPLPEERVLGWALEVSEGLEAAHRLGVVHRDIKPGNIFINGEGRAKILDFGLAKVVPSSLAETVDQETLAESLTSEGALLGTVHYMSPEQARGEPVDARSDLFSLGVVLYEMATGSKPFQGSTHKAVLNSILQLAPAEPRSLNPDLPEGLANVIEKLLEKDPEERYQSARELGTELRRLKRHSDDSGPVWGGAGQESLPDESPSRTRRLVRMALATLLVLAAVLVFTSWDGWRLWEDPTPASGLSTRHIAVLPLKQTGEHPEGRILSDGLMEALASQITRMHRGQASMWVVPVSEIISKDVRSAEQARRLFGVNLAVTGSLWFQDSDVRLTLNVVDANTLRQIDSTVIVQPIRELAGIQESTSRALAEMLKLEAGPASGSVLAAGSTSVTESYNLYLKGRGLLLRRDRSGNVEKAVEKFRQAIEADPGHALAHAGLSEAYRYRWQATREQAWLDKALEHSRRALELNDDLPAAQVSLGRLHAESGRHEEARTQFEKALEIDPLEVEALLGLAACYQAEGKPESAEDFYQKAARLRPDYWQVHNRLGGFYLKQGRAKEALQAYRRVVELTPDNPQALNNLGAAHQWLGQQEEAARAYRRSMQLEANYRACSNLATIAFNQGDAREAARLYEKALGLNDRNYLVWGNLAIASVELGRQGKARQAFHRAAELARERLEIDAGDAEVLSDLSLYLAHLGQADSARKRLEQALRTGSGNTFVMMNAVSVYVELDMRQEALKWLEKALEAGFSPETVERSPAFARLRDFQGYRETLQRFQTR